MSIWAHFSHILAAMAPGRGGTLASCARPHQGPFHAIKGIEWPFPIPFFLLAGARLDIHALMQVELVGAGYMALRISGQLIGTNLGGLLSASMPARAAGWG